MHLKEIKIVPVGYVRRTRADAWKKRPAVLRYYAYLDELRLKLNNFELGNAFEIEFGLPFPATYSKKKQTELLGQPHQVKPDLDNLVKAVCDGLRGTGEDNDSRIFNIVAKKVWDNSGYIKVKNLI
jgi:Holliday junction resolvase RusA-like endonuclease